MTDKQRKVIGPFRLWPTVAKQLGNALILVGGQGKELLAESFFMQKVDGPGVDLHQHTLGNQLVEIVAGGISLQRKTLRQIAGGKHLAQLFRIEKVSLIGQKRQ